MNMDDVLEKLVKNVFYIVSVIVDIAAIIGLYKEITKDIPSITMLIIYAMVLMLAIIAAVAYSIVTANKKANALRARALENTGDIFKVIHKELIHKVRNKLGEAEGEDYLSTSMRKDLLDTCGEILETLVKLQMALNGKKKISACIKLTLPIGTTRINDETKKETFLTTYARTKNTDHRRKKKREPTPIEGNTDFESIIDGDDCFICGDLPTLQSNGRYRNTTTEFGKYYRSTICVPIRLLKSILMDDSFESEDVYELLGFLCIDTKELMPEWENEDSFAFHLTALFADSLYILMQKYMSLPPETLVGVIEPTDKDNKLVEKSENVEES